MIAIGEPAEIAIKRPKYTGFSRALVADGIRLYIKALPDGVPGLPSPEALRTVIGYDVKIRFRSKRR